MPQREISVRRKANISSLAVSFGCRDIITSEWDGRIERDVASLATGVVMIHCRNLFFQVQETSVHAAAAHWAVDKICGSRLWWLLLDRDVLHQAAGTDRPLSV